ncbi:MAG TPA: lysophospholipid acyltransferase family protein [Thermoanaerobaculia bacterium]|nr:lysophospholipid acyltransferase family protein [Thermoanaerobaculia bacterium]
MRRSVTALLRVLIRVFFKEIEIVNMERVPEGVPVIFAVNHPNALIDPLFLLCFAPRPVSFLAKAPLFTMPVIGWFVRAFDSIPVYRRQDNVAGSNEETFAQARALLARGGAIAIFPEGTTHSDPRLRELKTGAARIAIGLERIAIVPVGLYYTAKQEFRSSAVMQFGEPIFVRGGQALMPVPAEVDALTQRIDDALDAVTLQADSHEALALIARGERIFSAGRFDPAEELEARRRFVEGYAWLRAHDPQRLARLQSRVEQLAAELDELKIEPQELPGARFAASLRVLSIMFVALPLAVIGAIVHFPAYRLVGFIARHFVHEEEMVATIKALAGALVYLLTWIAVAALAWWRLGPRWAVAAIVVVPILGWIALRFFERLDDVIGRARALTWRVARRRAYERLRNEQRAIRDEVEAIDALIARADRGADSPAAATTRSPSGSAPPR